MTPLEELKDAQARINEIFEKREKRAKEFKSDLNAIMAEIDDLIGGNHA